MCGIAGIWHRDGRGVNRDAIQCMADTLIHRGPGGEGLDVAGPIALGHRRLKVIDLTDAAAQPMWLPDRFLCLLCNGEIHNYLEVAAQLRVAEVRLRSQSDTTERDVRGWRTRCGRQIFCDRCRLLGVQART